MPAATYIQKLVIPTPPPGVVDRPRLSRRLDASADVPLTVVHGPPGSGKTTAVAAWARRAGPTPAWVTLDRDDRDPRRLATTLRAGFERWLGGAAPTRRRPTTAEEAEEVVVDLLDAVAARGTALTLVLDGVAAVRDSEASGLLRSLLRYVPDDLHLVVVAGGRVPVAIGRLRLGGRLVEVDGHDLRFRLDETAALLRDRAGADVPPAVVAEVHDLTEGHVTFAVAAAAALRGRGLADPGWADAVVAPHLDGLRPDQRALVADLAPLGAVSAEMADAVTGRRGSAPLLADLAGETAVVAPAEGPRGFRLHPLVRRALLARGAADEPARAAATHRAAAHWLEQRGDVEGAIDEWLAAGDDRTAWGLIAEHHVATWFAGGHEAVDRWVERLPVTSAPVEPEQAAGRAALLLMVGRPDEASRWVEQATAGAEAAGRGDDLAPLLGHLRAQTHLLWGDLHGTLALHRTPDADRIGRVGRPYGQISTAIAEVEALAQLGRFDEARRTFLAMAPWAPFEGAMAPVLVAGVHASLLSCEGRLTEALALAATGLAQARDLVGPEGPGTAWAHLAVGTTLLEQGEVHDAVPALVRAERVARRTGLAHLGIRAAAALARSRWLQGHPAEAFATIEAARRSPHLHPLPDPLPAWLDHAEARLHLLAGDPDEARAVLAAEDVHPEAVVLRAWAALDGGDRALALDLLADDLGPAASLGCRIEADLLRVRSQRDPVRARRHIARAVHRGSVDGYVTVFLDHRDGVADALHDQRGTEPSPYVNDLLFLLDAGDGMRLVEALTERELAVLVALRSSRTIEAIAADLEVSVNTLKTHVKAVYRKLEASTRSDAVRRALALRIIGPVAHPADEAVVTTS